MAHPVFQGESKSPRHLVDYVHLSIDGVPAISFVGALDPFTKPIRNRLPLRAEPLNLYLGSHLLVFDGVDNEFDSDSDGMYLVAST
jgi:hypothetical protein